MKKIVYIALFPFLVSCTSQTIAPTATKAELLEEQQIQRQMVSQQSYSALEKAPAITSAMQKRYAGVASQVKIAALDLCAGIGEKECDFSFELEESEVLNAYADGSKVVITTAMMEFASTNEELMNVVAHEYAHNIMQHIDSKKGNYILGTLAGIALDAAIGGGSFGQQIGSSVGASSYSVSFEQEADYVGLYIFARTGYDPSKAIGFWRKMSVANESAIDHGVTHPTNPERFVSMKKTIEEIAAKRAAGQPLLPRFKK